MFVIHVFFPRLASLLFVWCTLNMILYVTYMYTHGIIYTLHSTHTHTQHTHTHTHHTHTHTHTRTHTGDSTYNSSCSLWLCCGCEAWYWLKRVLRWVTCKVTSRPCSCLGSSVFLIVSCTCTSTVCACR